MTIVIIGLTYNTTIAHLIRQAVVAVSQLSQIACQRSPTDSSQGTIVSF